MKIIEFLQNNSSWLKDIFTILFTATGTLIAILSYRRARSTIFQPKRTEVTKRQTEILSEFLTLFTQNGNTIDRSIDYAKILRYNIDMTFRDYNLAEIDILSEKYIEYEQNIAGWMQFLENDIHEFIYVEGSITEYDNLIFEKNDRERQKFYESRAKQGDFKIHRIFYTKEYSLFIKKLRDLSNNPFLPKDIQDVATQIGNNITQNIHYKLRETLEELVKSIYKDFDDKNSNNYELIWEKVKYKTLWRDYETKRINHKEDSELLTKRIREHLMIDSKW